MSKYGPTDPEFYGCTPEECATTPSRHRCIPHDAEPPNTAHGLNPGEIVAVPSELPDPENWEVLCADRWMPATRTYSPYRCICRPINKEAGE